ncbi:hypothetical protein [Psychroserpens sp.]|uniref:hypothetical protein n=1 Tax=Psychroserpens sp. TaxID=2020870 RepID=UPI001AFF3AD6|nr:hypothetical protein [Psychroserpens sp.]MBO6606328.1 hypothetical protein [Psychroserpens sp.]MBO6631969.1 hypothetical protein [Psychroserpens sp.]MBO6653032.1 hypothetical protein [Psychroserpens sp.]MBO6680941.1 hypothetical protein [Psychroserpens sp.]MBO6750103.1 hypothetical protein [Psychroserpens sp.]
MKRIVLILIFCITNSTFSQNENSNSDTRKFISDAEFTQINRDWNQVARFTSGLGEQVSFFPVEAINLKTNERINSLQMDMTVTSSGYNYYKQSWIDLDEIDEFIFFLEEYIMPNLENKTGNKQSVTYIFNSKEIVFEFQIRKNKKRTSIFLKDYGITDTRHYFWTETQVTKIPRLLTMLKELK